MVTSFEDIAFELLARGHAVRFEVHGGSMTPAIRDGDTVEAEAVNAYEVQPGEIILFRQTGGRLVVHRVIDAVTVGNEILLTTRGDNLTCSDGAIRGDQVLARVRVVARGRPRLLTRLSVPRRWGYRMMMHLRHRLGIKRTMGRPPGLGDL